MRVHPLVEVVILCALVLAACASPTSAVTPTSLPPTSTPIPPTSTPAPRPTGTPTEAFAFPESADELVGIWTNPAISTHGFNADGTLYYSHSVEGLVDPLAIDKYWVDDHKLFLQEISVSGVFPCGKGGVATYEVKLLVSGKMKVRAIDEMCSTRKGATEGLYDPVR